MKRFALFVLTMWGLGLAASCAKHRGPEAGTNTNWLKRCDATSECGGDGSCMCGVCTQSCVNDSTCDALGGRSSCTQLTAGMCGASASGSACLPVELSSPSGAAGSAGPPSPAPVDGSLALTRVGAEVQITDRYRSCGNDDDCVLVSTGCDGCCQQDAIRAQDRDAYQTSFDRACSGYQGAICDCQPLDLVPICRDGACRALPRDEARDCYSPTQNATRAYDPGAVGCACEQAGLQICVGSAALSCDEGANGLRWTAVEDGACAMATSSCFPGASRPDAAACLAEFVTCLQLPTSGFCGFDCHGPLTCERPEGCDYRPLDSLGCSSSFYPMVWEGTCGDVRYRVESGGFGGPTSYWDIATGKFLAATNGNDIPSFCNGNDTQIRLGDLNVIRDCEVVTDATTQICP